MLRVAGYGFILNLKKKIAEIPIAEWGLNIQEIFPRSDNAYIKDFIYKGGSGCTRNAIIEQIISKMSKQDVRKILNKMKEHGNSLDGYQKALYDHSSEESYRRINELLSKKEEDE